MDEARLSKKPASTAPGTTGISAFLRTDPEGKMDRFPDILAEVDEYAIILLDVDGNIQSWNKGAERIKGYVAEEVIGRSFSLFYPPDDMAANVPQTLLEIASREGKVNKEGWRIRKDGSRFWGSVTITALRDDKGQLTGFLKMTRDLTDRRLADENLRKQAEQIRRKNEELRRSEERFHKMVTEIKDYAIILLDKEGTILEWNRGAEAVKGYRASEIVGSSFKTFYTPEDRERALPERLLAEARKFGSTTHEGWRLRKDGTRFWGYVSITALHDDNGEIIGFSKITRDFSEKKAAEQKLATSLDDLRHKNEELRRSEQRYHRMVNEVEDYAIVFLNTKGEIENWNSGAAKIKGYAEHEVIGRSFTLFYPPEDVAAGLPESLLTRARNYGKAIHEGWRLRKDGTRFWASVVITALHDDHHQVIGFSKVTRDLTSRKEAEQLMDQKNRALQQANAELSSFAFVASHDLKEPLRKIQVFTSRIADTESLSEKNAEYIGKIIQSAQRMQRLIEDLLSFSKLSTAGEFEPVDLNQVVADVKNDLEVTITEKHATIRSESLPTIRGTAFQLHQLFLNLFSNSLKFSRADADPVITISYEAVNGPVAAHGVNTHTPYHRIRISDNGIGFSQDHAAKIFDVFYRLHSREKFEGAGIGLAIVKRVVENHKGVIATEGIPGVGASFFIYLAC